MKKLFSKNNRLLKIVLGAVICVGIVIIAVMCADEDCKTCTSSKLNKTEEFCGDDLKQAQMDEINEWICK
jgi:hypothetical protein